MVRGFRSIVVLLLIVVTTVAATFIYLHRRAVSNLAQAVHRSMMEKLCVRQGQFIIGLPDTAAVRAYVDACNTDANHNVVIKRPLMGYREFEYSSDTAPGKNVTSQLRGGVATFTSLAAPTSFTVRLSRPVSAVRWSPDGDFVFYIGKANAQSSLPLKECLDDSFAIHVIDMQSHHDDVISKVCAGFPYTSLRWLQR